MQTNGFGRPATGAVAFLRIKNMWSLVAGHWSPVTGYHHRKPEPTERDKTQRMSVVSGTATKLEVRNSGGHGSFNFKFVTVVQSSAVR
uniref:Uncharacterized protein n=1 Tax=Talaromyces marneffei PM1 TaxID=1077442 RepID=A0A093UN04_TALMA